MDFWNTALGHQLADTLIRNKQFMIVCHSDDEVEKEITHQWNLGNRLMNSIVLKNKTILIFEE